MIDEQKSVLLQKIQNKNSMYGFIGEGSLQVIFVIATLNECIYI